MHFTWMRFNEMFSFCSVKMKMKHIKEDTYIIFPEERES